MEGPTRNGAGRAQESDDLDAGYSSAPPRPLAHEEDLADGPLAEMLVELYPNVRYVNTTSNKAKPPSTLSVREVAEDLGIGLGQAYEAVKAGEIPALKVGGCWLVSRTRYQHWRDGSGD